jgi:hypothetical protein
MNDALITDLANKTAVIQSSPFRATSASVPVQDVGKLQTHGLKRFLSILSDFNLRFKR